MFVHLSGVINSSNLTPEDARDILVLETASSEVSGGGVAETMETSVLRDTVDNDVVGSVAEQSLSIEGAEQTERQVVTPAPVTPAPVTPLVVDSDEDDFISETPTKPAKITLHNVNIQILNGLYNITRIFI